MSSKAVSTHRYEIENDDAINPGGRQASSLSENDSQLYRQGTDEYFPSALLGDWYEPLELEHYGSTMRMLDDVYQDNVTCINEMKRHEVSQEIISMAEKNLEQASKAICVFIREVQAGGYMLVRKDEAVNFFTMVNILSKGKLACEMGENAIQIAK